MHFSNLLSTVLTTALALYPSSAISAYVLTLYDQTGCGGGNKYVRTREFALGQGCMRFTYNNFDGKSLNIENVADNCQVYAYTDRNQGCSRDGHSNLWEGWISGTKGCQA
jgi:hypothetical protein